MRGEDGLDWTGRIFLPCLVFCSSCVFYLCNEVKREEWSGGMDGYYASLSERITKRTHHNKEERGKRHLWDGREAPAVLKISIGKNFKFTIAQRGNQSRILIRWKNMGDATDTRLTRKSYTCKLPACLFEFRFFLIFAKNIL